MRKKSEVVFSNDKLEKEFYKMDPSDELKKHIIRAIVDIQENAFVGVSIPKKLIPKEYAIKYNPKNLWKYDLPGGWRILYTITTPSKVEILSVILEWLDHKDYERRFGY